MLGQVMLDTETKGETLIKADHAERSPCQLSWLQLCILPQKMRAVPSDYQ